MTSSHLVFRTRLCDLLGIDYPVLQSGMGLVAALALGASGVLMGTRFVATRESMAFAAFKKAELRTRRERRQLITRLLSVYLDDEIFWLTAQKGVNVGFDFDQ